MRFEEEIALDQQRFVDRYDGAVAVLRRVPGVLSVGVGARERRGEILPEVVFRVYVAEKIAASELPKEHLVPRVVCGLPTDVIVKPDVDELAGTLDSTKYRPLQGGCQIRAEKFEGDNTRGMGTLGCLAKMADGSIVGLTAQHVSCAGTDFAVGAGPGSFACVGVKIGQPRHITCCCCCTFNEIGAVLRAEKSAQLDCAIVKLDDDTANDVRTAGTVGTVADIGVVTGVATAVLLSEVRKRGAATQLTRGTVIDVLYEGSQILIHPLPAFPKFADYGDSGAVIVNAAGKVVGLLWGADRTTRNRGVANHIAPVVAAMGITITGGASVLGPSNVPGLSQYGFKLDVPVGSVVAGITWTIDKPSASILGSANNVDVTVRFTNAAADFITLRADFTIDGAPGHAEKEIALVQITVDPVVFTNAGLPTSSAPPPKVFLVDPPAAPAVPTWVTTHDPGSDVGAFTYNGALQAAEPRSRIASGGVGGNAFRASTKVTLTSPVQRPNAHLRIQIGYIQHGADVGSATYAPVGRRTVTTPTADTVDWLSSPPGPSDDWPWYDRSARLDGTSGTLVMVDSPMLSLPSQHNPNKPAEAGSANPLNTAAETLAFTIQIAVRTIDPDLGADNHYFDASHSTWSVNFAWPVVAGVSIVTIGPAWTVPAAPAEVSVNVVPTSINHNEPFLRWIPS